MLNEGFIVAQFICVCIFLTFGKAYLIFVSVAIIVVAGAVISRFRTEIVSAGIVVFVRTSVCIRNRARKQSVRWTAERIISQYLINIWCFSRFGAEGHLRISICFLLKIRIIGWFWLLVTVVAEIVIAGSGRKC